MLKQSREELINISGMLTGISISVNDAQSDMLIGIVEKIDNILVNEDRPFIREDVKAIINDEIITSNLNCNEDFNFDNIVDRIVGIIYG